LAYTVKKGDTLWDIAKKQLGSGAKYKEIAKLNPQIKDPNRIYPGQVLKLPGEIVPKPATTTAPKPVSGPAVQPKATLSVQTRVEPPAQYRQKMENILGRLEQRLTQPVDITQSPYYKANLEAAQQAADLASRRAMEELNRRGILSSTITGDRIAQIQQQYMTQILPQVMEQAYGIRQGEVRNLLDLLGAYSGLEQQQYERQIAEQQMQIEAEETQIKRAWDRVKNLGYVDNLASIALGIPVGTPSFEAQKAVDDRLARLKLARENNAAAMARVRASSEAAMQRLLQQQAFEREQPDYQVKQNLWNKINNYGLDFLTDDEKVLAQSLLGIDIPGEKPPKIDEYATNQALSRYLPLSIKEREEFLSDEQRLAALAREGVDIEKLYLYKNWQGGE